MSKFGEPWEHNRWNNNEVISSDGGVLYKDAEQEDFGGFASDEYLSRTVACVNALAGVENPEAVKQLLDWMHLVSLRIQAGTIYQEELLEELDCFGFKIFGDDWKKGKDAP